MERKTIEDCITDQGLLVSGNGIICENTRKIAELLDKLLKAGFHMENKVEALMDEKAIERHEKIKERFK